jgi:hypothetical protein
MTSNAEQERMDDALLDEVVRGQNKIAKKRNEALLVATPGVPVAHIDARGYGMKHVQPKAVAKKQQKGGLAGLSIFLGQGCSTKSLSPDALGENNSLVEKLEDASAVVVRDVAGDGLSAGAFHARCYGLALADPEWVRTSGKSGRCLKFPNIVETSCCSIRLGLAFRKEQPHITEILKVASKKVWPGM